MEDLAELSEQLSRQDELPPFPSWGGCGGVETANLILKGGKRSICE